jgi:integrase
MATIRERGPYQWQAQILRKGQSPQYKTFNNKSDAEKWARSIEAEMDRGAFVSRKEAENTMLAEALDRYEREITPKKKGHQEKNIIRKWKNHSLSKRPLASIQGKDVAEYQDERLKTVSPNTVRLDLALLSHLFTIAVKEWGMAGLVNPVMQIRKPKLPQGRDRRLRSGELDAICAASESPVLADLVRFAGEAGMRRGELAGMTWELVDLKKRTVTLPDTKNGEKRVVPLSTEAVRILTGLVRRIDGKVWGLEPDSITQAFIRALSRARTAYEKECEEKGMKPDSAFLVDLTFHDLRHEATSRFFEKGLNPMEVSAITGHKTLQMLKRYTHLKAEDLAELLK